MGERQRHRVFAWLQISGRAADLPSGVDYKVSPNFAVGLAAGYVGTTADLTDHGRVWVNGGKLGVYATTFVGGWYADAAAFSSCWSYSTRRSSIEGEARGDTDGGELNALFGTGYDFKARGFTFGPTATFNYTYVGFNDFTEHNALAPLNIHGADENSYRSAFGARASYDCKCGSVIIRPELRAAWQQWSMAAPPRRADLEASCRMAPVIPSRRVVRSWAGTAPSSGPASPSKLTIGLPLTSITTASWAGRILNPTP